MARIEVDVELPSLPNFVKVGGNSIDIADVSEETLRQIGAEWTEALVANARLRRDIQERQP